MLNQIIFFIHTFISLFKSDQKLYAEILILKKENLILKRKHPNQRFRISRFDKIIYVILDLLYNIKGSIILFSPQTVLKWQNSLVASFWTFLKKDSHPGRPPVPSDVKELILNMKNDNLLWGIKKIRDELLKLSIALDKQTIRNILRDFRKKGKIKKTLSWKKFILAHIDSLYAMDFFTVDTIFNKRFYVLFFIKYKSREITQFAITQNPAKEFLKQQVIELENKVKQSIYLIHDRDPVFMSFPWAFYNITNVFTSVQSPNMNAVAERFVRSIRYEALDNFIILNQNQVAKIINEYIEYYNAQRPHQGINQIPGKEPPDLSKCSHHLKSPVSSKPILCGLHHHYFYKDKAA